MIELARAAQRGGRWKATMSNRKYRDGFVNHPNTNPPVQILLDDREPAAHGYVPAIGATQVETWRFNWRGILRIAAILLLAIGMAVAFSMTVASLTSCQAIQREVPQVDPKTGAQYYVDPDGKNGSTQKTDAQGNPRKEFTLPENNGLLKNAGDLLGGALPPPFGDLGRIVFGLGSAAATAWALRERARRLAEAGLTDELVTSIDNAPAARVAVAKHASHDHSARLKSRVQELRAKRAKQAAKQPTAAAAAA
jgi:hypothetical protein